MYQRIFPKLKITGNDTEDDKYYELLCILNVPFRNNMNDNDALKR